MGLGIVDRVVDRAVLAVKAVVKAVVVNGWGCGGQLKSPILGMTQFVLRVARPDERVVISRL